MGIGEFNFGLNEVDDSGRPVPEDVVAVLDSGVRVPCAVRYDGVDRNRSRRYIVMAEIDWENYQIDVLEIGVLPYDVVLVIKVSGLNDEDHAKYVTHMRAKVLRHT
jgi:hypothetical protein